MLAFQYFNSKIASGDKQHMALNFPLFCFGGNTLSHSIFLYYSLPFGTASNEAPILPKRLDTSLIVVSILSTCSATFKKFIPYQKKEIWSLSVYLWEKPEIYVLSGCENGLIWVYKKPKSSKQVRVVGKLC